MHKKSDSKKIRILYQVDILAHWLLYFSGRSGIFFVTYNILEKLIKNENIEMTFLCKLIHYQAILNFCETCYPNNKIEVIVTDIPMCIASKFPYKNKIVKSIASVENKNKIQNDSTLKRIIKKTLYYTFFYPIKKIFEYCNVPNMVLRCSNYDVYFSSCFKIPNWISYIKRIKKYTILYDTIPDLLPEYIALNMQNDSWYRKLARSLNKNEYYFAISENTKKDFLKIYSDKLDSEKIIVTPLACSESFKPADESLISSVKEKYKIPKDKKYVFSLCTLEPRKNLIRAVKTFFEFIKKNNIDDMVFVLGGGHWEEFISILNNKIEEYNTYKDKVIKIGYVDDEDLAPLYSGAEWFVYTSMYEGFGLPPLEAMSCGCPVITSNNSSLPEVVGDAGIMINYDNDEEHIKAYEDYYYNEGLREKNRIIGLERAKNFTWDKCANLMIDFMFKNLEK